MNCTNECLLVNISFSFVKQFSFVILDNDTGLTCPLSQT